MNSRLMPLSEIKPNPDNPRIIKDDKFAKLVKSIKEFPEMLKIRPLVVNADMVVLGGNMRLKACQAAGLSEVPVILASGLTDEQQREFIIKDNVGFGEWEWETLANEWDAEQLAEWGLDIPDFEKVTEDGLIDPDEVPEAPVTPTTVLGDLWILGNHRVLCGDSTDVKVWESLTGSSFIDLCFTSPPYALGDSIKLSGNKHKSQNESAYDGYTDSSSEWPDLMDGWWNASFPFVQSWFVNLQMLAGNKSAFVKWIADRTEHLSDILIWDKGHGAPHIAQGIVGARHEYLMVFDKEHATRRIPFSSWQGTMQSVYEAPPQRQNDFAKIHGATMPSHLPEWVLSELMNNVKSVIDPFCGTGTTIIAAERCGKIGYGIELSPQYVDVIVKRWQDFTGRDAIHSVTGKTFNDHAQSAVKQP